MLPKLRRLLIGLALCLAGITSPAFSQDVLKFQVAGQNPGGESGYSGTVELTKAGKTSGTIRWVTGTNKEVTDGIVIRTDKGIGAAYGGEALYAMAVYELKGKSILATWITAAKPGEAGNYTLTGSDFKGTCSFADGTAGSVTFTPGKGGLYKVVWDLQAGRYEGIGVRVGDVLVAASGDVKKYFGVAAYAPKGDDIAGLWGTTQMTSPGKETWSLPADGAEPVAKAPGSDGRSVVFGGQTYLLMENKSAPGQATSELREYLQAGEDWAGYRKLVGLRMQNVKGADATTLARATLEQVQKQHPSSFVNEIEMQPDTATILFILVTSGDVEFNLWNYRKTSSGVASAQFVLRNKPPFETQKKFKAEQDRNYDSWITEIKKLGGEAEALLAASAGVAAGAPVAKKDEKPALSDAELAKAIKGDLDKCVAVAEKFVDHMEAGRLAEGVALMSDRTFESTSRPEFIKKLERSNQVFGKLKKFVPDKKATDFGVKGGIMTFTLQGDGEYENGVVRETLTFIRNEQGGVEFVAYNRTAKP